MSSFNDAMSASCSAAVMPRVAASCCNFLAIIDKLGRPTIRLTISSSGISASASLISLAVPWITVACVVMIFDHSRANPSIIHNLRNFYILLPDGLLPITGAIDAIATIPPNLRVG